MRLEVKENISVVLLFAQGYNINPRQCAVKGRIWDLGFKYTIYLLAKGVSSRFSLSCGFLIFKFRMMIMTSEGEDKLKRQKCFVAVK